MKRKKRKNETGKKLKGIRLKKTLEEKKKSKGNKERNA